MKYLIERDKDKIMSFLIGNDGHAVEIHADARTDDLKLGDIVIGRVEKVAENTGACFVEIGRGVKGYLPFEDIADPLFTKKGSSRKVIQSRSSCSSLTLQQGDELVVQVSREAFGSKGMSLTTKLQQSGRYLVLQKNGTGVGISRKMAEERRQDLKENLFSQEMLEKLRQTLGSCGVIVRTNAEHADNDDIRRELEDLEASLRHILLTAPYRTAFSVLFRQPDVWLKRTDSLPEDKTESILTDDKELYKELKDYLTFPMSEKLRLYQDDMISMHSIFSLTRELGGALSRRVNMKSGASLVIEQTEALVSIDVNSSHFIGGKDKEKAALKVNLEAARECARQIRLRNLSGMILIDFINMDDPESYGQLMHELKAAALPDPMKVQVVDRTALGLVEMTRRKVEAPLWMQLREKAPEKAGISPKSD